MSSESTQQASDRRRRGIVIGIAVVAVIIVASIVVAMLSGDDEVTAPPVDPPETDVADDDVVDDTEAGSDEEGDGDEPEATDDPDLDDDGEGDPEPAGPSVDDLLALDGGLRDVSPDDVRIGVAVAGGGHHEQQPYPDPFPNDEPYRELIAREFDSVTPENQLKWEFVHPRQGEYNLEPAENIVAFAQENGQDVRGHTLLWHSQNPSWLEQGDFTEDELREILRDHIQTVVGHFAGEITQWDVANEIFDDNAQLRMDENIWLRELGVEIVADAFRWAHEADPDALLFLNDYNVDGMSRKSDAYYELVQELLADDVPVHGFAIQGHLSIDYGFPSGVEENLRRFDDLGLETAVTELDVRMTLVDGSSTEQQLTRQADDYTQMLDACLNVEGCRSFTIWGLTDRYSWVPHFFAGEGAALLLDDELAPRPAYFSLRERLEAGRP